jgi:hypothetical protein
LVKGRNSSTSPVPEDLANQRPERKLGEGCHDFVECSAEDNRAREKEDRGSQIEIGPGRASHHDADRFDTHLFLDASRYACRARDELQIAVGLAPNRFQFLQQISLVTRRVDRAMERPVVGRAFFGLDHSIQISTVLHGNSHFTDEAVVIGATDSCLLIFNHQVHWL